MHSGIARVRLHVNDVDSAAAEAGQDETVAALGLVAKAAGTGVPPRMVNLVPDIRHETTTYNLERKS